MAVNPDKLNAFMSKGVGDIGAALSANMVLLGDKLGLYKAMAKAGPVTPTELAKATKTAERYVREWLGNQAAGGYMTYDAGTGRYMFPEEQAMALADESSPCFLPGAFQVIAATFSANPKIEQRSRPARVSGGISTTTGCLKARRDFSARITWATSWHIGFPPLTA